jgi:hypothetical protein
VLFEKQNRLNLLSYITGSTPANFIGSIAKANINFQVASSSKYNEYIDNKIVLVNNSADGFVMSQIGKQLEILEERTGRKAVQWSERERLLSILN